MLRLLVPDTEGYFDWFQPIKTIVRIKIHCFYPTLKSSVHQTGVFRGKSLTHLFKEFSTLCIHLNVQITACLSDPCCCSALMCQMWETQGLWAIYTILLISHIQLAVIQNYCYISWISLIYLHVYYYRLGTRRNEKDAWCICSYQVWYYTIHNLWLLWTGLVPVQSIATHCPSMNCILSSSDAIDTWLKTVVTALLSLNLL